MDLIDNAPASLDTFNEFAAALADDATFATTIENILNNKADTSTTYTKSEANDLLVQLVNQSTTYMKTAVNATLSAKANQSTTWKNTEENEALSANAHQSFTYTKLEVSTH